MCIRQSVRKGGESVWVIEGERESVYVYQTKCKQRGGESECVCVIERERERGSVYVYQAKCKQRRIKCVGDRER